ncbi:hypothetical protein [Actinoallomurus sp. NPDC050550]|uniref:hypothetical protein n=1 Tax=Actinoallomurus sp. NPDC050550 TaxID=3154937 RepID=UPI0033D79CC4
MSPHIRTVVTEDRTEIQIERVPWPLPLPQPKDLSTLNRRMHANPNININITDEAIDTTVGTFLDLPKVIRIATHEAGIDGLSSQYARSTHLFMLEGDVDPKSLSCVIGNTRLGHLLQRVPKGAMLPEPATRADAFALSPSSSSTRSPSIDRTLGGRTGQSRLPIRGRCDWPPNCFRSWRRPWWRKRGSAKGTNRTGGRPRRRGCRWWPRPRLWP